MTQQYAGKPLVVAPMRFKSIEMGKGVEHAPKAQVPASNLFGNVEKQRRPEAEATQQPSVKFAAREFYRW
ncbi:MAG: hypothetical protein J0L82_18875 [Deltaproteobacteria bacterium]|nr:hypothetical protein [Deltaproteobacteria bacterium]